MQEKRRTKSIVAEIRENVDDLKLSEGDALLSVTFKWFIMVFTFYSNNIKLTSLQMPVCRLRFVIVFYSTNLNTDETEFHKFIKKSNLT